MAEEAGGRVVKRFTMIIAKKKAAAKMAAATNWLHTAASGGNRYNRDPSAEASIFCFWRKEARSPCLRLTNIKKWYAKNEPPATPNRT